jgi:hypothetical protein
MAIKINIETPGGVKVDNAYCRIENISLTKDTLMFSVRNYVVPTKPFFSEDSLSCPYDILGENPFKQAYLHIKTLPEFAGAVDA